jgi:hypothetical protein
MLLYSLTRAGEIFNIHWLRKITEEQDGLESPNHDGRDDDEGDDDYEGVVVMVVVVIIDDDDHCDCDEE